MKNAFLSFFILLSNLIFAKPDYVSCELMGELGNQMFQIAATLNVAYEMGARAVFPDLKKNPNYNIPLNYKFIFNKLDTTLPAASFQLYRESTFHYTPIRAGRRNIKLFGYFNSEKYFKNHKDKIIEVFQPSKEIEAFLIDKYSEYIHHPKTVSVHLRTFHKDRAQTPDIENYHPFVGWNYVIQAMSFFDDEHLFLVFSDDMPFVKKEMSKLNLPQNIVFIEGNSHFHDFYLMSFCKNNIISNSTFSWWAAYLNKNTNKKVIAPKRWLGIKYPEKNTKDVIPSNWIVL